MGSGEFSLERDSLVATVKRAKCLLATNDVALRAP